MRLTEITSDDTDQHAARSFIAHDDASRVQVTLHLLAYSRIYNGQAGEHLTSLAALINGCSFDHVKLVSTRIPSHITSDTSSRAWEVFYAEETRAVMIVVSSAEDTSRDGDEPYWQPMPATPTRRVIDACLALACQLNATRNATFLHD